MKAIAILVVIVVFQMVDTGRIEAQSVDPLKIVISAGLGRADDRGDRASHRMPVDADKIGETRAVTISRLAGQCGLGSSSPTDADTGEAFDGSITGRSGAGAISMSFWWRRCALQSRSHRWVTAPVASPAVCTSMCRARAPVAPRTAHPAEAL